MKEKAIDPAELKKIGMIQQKQPGKFAMRLRAVGGDLKVEQLKRIAEVAKKYGEGFVHLSTRQGVEIHGVDYRDLEAARLALAKADVRMGACGPRVRVIVACPGEATCRWGIIETKAIAKELDANYFCQDTPHKFKLAVTGCPHNCAKATENDIGVTGAILPKWHEDICTDCRLCVNVCPTLAITREEAAGKARYILDEKKCINCSICTKTCPVGAWQPAVVGYNLSIGGTMGKLPRFGTMLKKLVASREELYLLVDRSLKYYQRYGRKKERFGHMIDRIGTDKVVREILNG